MSQKSNGNRSYSQLKTGIFGEGSQIWNEKRAFCEEIARAKPKIKPFFILHSFFFFLNHEEWEWCFHVVQWKAPVRTSGAKKGDGSAKQDWWAKRKQDLSEK